MQNRKYKIDGEDLRTTISKAWNLSLEEEDALNSFLNILKEGDLRKINLYF